MRARRVLRYHRRTVVAAAGVDLIDFRMSSARECERTCGGGEIARADPASTWFVLLDDAVHWTGPDRRKPHRYELHAADGTRPFLAFDDVRVHRARPGDRRQPGLSNPGAGPHQYEYQREGAFHDFGKGSGNLFELSRDNSKGFPEPFLSV